MVVIYPGFVPVERISVSSQYLEIEIELTLIKEGRKVETCALNEEIRVPAPVGVGVPVGVDVGVTVGVHVGVPVCLGVSVYVGMPVGVHVGMPVGVDVGVTVGVHVGVPVCLGVSVCACVRHVLPPRKNRVCIAFEGRNAILINGSFTLSYRY